MAAEMKLSSLQVSDAKLAVEARGASENQPTTLARESAFVDLAAPPARSRAEIRHTRRTSSAATASFEDSRQSSALLSWLSQADSEPAPWPKVKIVDAVDTSIIQRFGGRESVDSAWDRHEVLAVFTRHEDVCRKKWSSELIRANRKRVLI